MIFGTAKAPLIVPSLFGWLDGMDPTGTGSFATLGLRQARWMDKSGRGNHTDTQSTDANRATWTDSQQAGKPTMVFDGTNDTYALPSTYYALANGPNTIIGVAKTTLATTQQRIVSLTEASSFRTGIEFGSNSGEVTYQSRTSAASSVTVTGVTKTNYNIFSCYRSGTTQSIQSNGGTAVTNSNGADESGIDAAYLGSTLGSGLYLNGGIAEILFFSGALSTDQLIFLGRYLANKWAISHP